MTRTRRLPALLWVAFVLFVIVLFAGGWAVTPKEPPPSPPCFDDRANPICDRIPDEPR